MLHHSPERLQVNTEFNFGSWIISSTRFSLLIHENTDTFPRQVREDLATETNRRRLRFCAAH